MSKFGGSSTFVSGCALIHSASGTGVGLSMNLIFSPRLAPDVASSVLSSTGYQTDSVSLSYSTKTLFIVYPVVPNVTGLSPTLRQAVTNPR